MGADRADASPPRPFGLDLSMPVFDRATRIARTLFAGGESLIILVENGVVWRSRDVPVGASNDDPAAEVVIATGELLWVEDASLDPRFSDLSLVTGPPFVRSYIGAPIRLEDGTTPGLLCAVALTPQPYDAVKAARLQDLADFVADEWTRAKAKRAHSEAARALSSAQATLAALCEIMPIPLAMTDRDLNILAVSRRSPVEEAAHDFSAMVGRSIFELSPLLEEFRPAFQQALAGETAPGVQLAMPRSDGSTAWVQVEVSAWRDEQGEPGGVVVTANDVSQLKAALDHAERSEERLNLAMSLADVHVWEIDYVRRALFKAGAEDTFFETPRSYEDLYRDIYVTIDPRDHAVVREAWRRHVEEGAPYRPHYRIARTDGKEVWTEGIIQLFTGADGRPERMVGALRNITAAKQAEQALVKAIEAAEAANLAKSQFLATMSHEIRTPLNGVLGMAQAMAADELSAAQRDRLGVIRESGQTLLGILNDVLDISKIEAGKLELENAPFAIEPVAGSALHAFSAIADEKGVRLRLEVAPAARGRYLGDATRVRQVLYNLVSNAVKFTDAGEVAVTVARSAGALKLTVSDTGVGIAPKDVTRLFEKFEQADTSTTRRYGGTGLGLAICRQLVEMMGGRIRVKSRMGGGTAFTVTLQLPYLGEAPAVAGEAQADLGAASLGGAALRVLAAEDNLVNQLVLKTLLGQLGVEPTVVGDGAAALQAWEQGAWDVILMDVQMPRMDGPSATRAIRAREAALGRHRTPIVALTANAMSHQIAEYQAAGMDAFVAKPIEVAQLFAALDEAVGRAPQPQAQRAAG